MHFCRKCGFFATVDFRHLRAKCLGSTRKGRENLSRIARGIYPRREGAPRAVREAALLDVEAEAVQRAAASRELQNVGAGPAPPGVASGSVEPEAVGLGPRAARSVSALPSAAPPDPEEEAAEWLFGE